MNIAADTRTRGAVQIVRDSEKQWKCSLAFYGQTAKFNTVMLDTKKVIALLRLLGAPAPVSGKESHVIEFYGAPRWNELKEFNFTVEAN